LSARSVRNQKGMAGWPEFGILRPLEFFWPRLTHRH
jgi:hypothetical protein